MPPIRMNAGIPALGAVEGKSYPVNQSLMLGQLTRTHVYSKAALSESQVVAIVEKLRPEAFSTVPEVVMSYSRLSPWPEDILAFLAGRLHRAGVDLDGPEAQAISYEEGMAWGSLICLISVRHPSGRRLRF